MPTHRGRPRPGRAPPRPGLRHSSAARAAARRARTAAAPASRAGPADGATRCTGRRWPPTPRPAIDRKSSARGAVDRRRAPAPRPRSALASGCSLSASTAAGQPQRRSSSARRPSPGDAGRRRARPWSACPSCRTATGRAIVRMRSSATRSLTRMPARRRHRPSTATPRGGWPARGHAGQAITRTVTDRTRACRRVEPRAVQADEGDERGAGGDVEEQRGEAIGQGLGPAARTSWAAATSRWMPARAVSSPNGVDPDPRAAESVDDGAGDHAVARPPSVTGRDSPVTMDSSNPAVRPSMTVRRPAPGRPGRTSTTSPTLQRRRAGTVLEWLPSGSTRSALVGQQLGQRASAPTRAWPSAFISSQ